jgi:hypothetical protein
MTSGDDQQGVRLLEHFLHRFEKGMSEPSTTSWVTPDAS